MPGWEPSANNFSWQIFPGESIAGAIGAGTVGGNGIKGPFIIPDIYRMADSYWEGHTDRWWGERNNPLLQLYDDPREPLARIRFRNSGGQGAVVTVSPWSWRDPQIWYDEVEEVVEPGGRRTFIIDGRIGGPGGVGGSRHVI